MLASDHLPFDIPITDQGRMGSAVGHSMAYVARLLELNRELHQTRLQRLFVYVEAAAVDTSSLRIARRGLNMATTKSDKQSKRKRPVAQPRKEIDPRTTELQQRFGIHLRELMGKKGLSAGDLHRFLLSEGIEISISAVTKWMRGEGFPNTLTLVIVAKALGVNDYRKVLPPPLD